MPAGIDRLVKTSLLSEFPNLYNGNLEGFVSGQFEHGPVNLGFPSVSSTLFTFTDQGSSWSFDSSPVNGTGIFEFKIGVPVIMNNFVLTVNLGSSPTVNATKYDLILRKKGSSTDKIVLDLLPLDGASTGHNFVSNSTDEFQMEDFDTFELVLDVGTVTSVIFSGEFTLTYNYVVKQPNDLLSSSSSASSNSSSSVSSGSSSSVSSSSQSSNSSSSVSSGSSSSVSSGSSSSVSSGSSSSVSSGSSSSVSSGSSSSQSSNSSSSQSSNSSSSQSSNSSSSQSSNSSSSSSSAGVAGLTVPNTAGFVEFGNTNCTGTTATTPVAFGDGYCNVNARKMWVVWDGPGPIDLLGQTFNDGDVKVFCPNEHFDSGPYYQSTNMTTYNRERWYASEKIINTMTSYKNLLNIRRNSNNIYIYNFDQTTITPSTTTLTGTNFVTASPGIIPKACYTIPYRSGIITLVPVNVPMAAPVNFLKVPKETGVFTFGLPKCTGTTATTPVGHGAGSCNGNARKVWINWQEGISGSPTTILGVSGVENGDTFVACPSFNWSQGLTTTLPTPTMSQEVWEANVSTTTTMGISGSTNINPFSAVNINQLHDTLTVSAFLGSVQQGIVTSMTAATSDGHIGKYCTSIPYFGGILTVVPINTPMT